MRTAKQRAAWAKLPAYVKRAIRKGPQSVWAKRIKREFSYVCAQCETPNSLEAHHIYFKSLYPSRREDLDNGLCICTKCHDKIHALYTENTLAYYTLVNQLTSKREKMKSISAIARNPSQSSYVGKYEHLPVEDKNLTPEEAPETKLSLKPKKKVEKKTLAPAKQESETKTRSRRKAPSKRPTTQDA
jgi:hypothetical protein